MHVSCIDSDVYSCFELGSALSQSSWIRCYISVIIITIIIITKKQWCQKSKITRYPL